MEPRFFATPAEFRAWFEENHSTESLLWVGFYKRATGKPSITWPESVDQALCFGWIDGLRKSIDDTAYMIRFSPRKPRSAWSAVNLAKMTELIASGLVTPAGMEAYERRPDESAPYSYERTAELSEEYVAEFTAVPEAWAWFERAAPSYRRAATNWVMSAKQEETRRRRLARLISDSASGTTVPPFTPPAKKPTTTDAGQRDPGR
jgi:uncharacterized protein YdeI (YjbR/CyaY-like superfamily)